MLYHQLFRKLVLCWLLSGIYYAVNAQSSIVADGGWANNSVNTVVFRKNSLVSFQDTQYASFYDASQYVVLAKRKLGSKVWQTVRTPYKGDATDAHKCICIMVDGANYLHVTWGHHNQPLNYCRSVAPGSLQLTAKLSMINTKESRVTYPEFFRLPSGDLLFFYRDGESGNGNIVLNRYSIKAKQWTRVQDNLIDGEGQRNAYWQITTDTQGTLHISWVWRETPDVASNHDMCYACSKDGGLTWQRSTGEKYKLPITAANAEYAFRIAQNSELINQTSMFADGQGHPYIATYWRDAGKTIPQYHLIYNSNGKWRTADLGFRKTPFSLSGVGTKSIPVSRPQVVAWKEGKNLAAALFFRDNERGDKVSVAINRNLSTNQWKVSDLSDAAVGSWEPSYDTELWKEKHLLDLFVQKTIQVDNEGKANLPPQPIQVIEWKP